MASITATLTVTVNITVNVSVTATETVTVNIAVTVTVIITVTVTVTVKCCDEDYRKTVAAVRLQQQDCDFCPSQVFCSRDGRTDTGYVQIPDSLFVTD